MAASSGFIITQKCRFCSKPRHAHEFVHGPVAGICWHCFTNWQDAFEVLAGRRHAPKGCADCRKTWEQLKHETPGADVKMYLHPKDGIAQFLCKTCSDGYEKKRLDLYGSTPYGEAKKLKGAK